jgi:glycosyltransferase involved in cell wall biosynthesis
MIGDWPQWDAGIHKVVYQGVVRDQNLLMEKFDACDVLLLPSLSEGMPTVILEAMARGLDVIASDVGAVSELVENPLSPGDSRALAQAIKNSHFGCLQHSDLRRFLWTTIANHTMKALSSDASAPPISTSLT